jgi:sigma-B regulation protein RsbU (phosphoserine phosphatase)
MPKFNGVEVLKKARISFTPLELPIIMMTARGEAKDIIAALELGANDYITKPIDFPIAFARIQTHLLLNKSFREIEELKQNLGDKNEKLETANRRLNRDLEAAAAIQQAQLPDDLPIFPGVNFAWIFEPHEKLAGDMLHVFPIGTNKVGFFVLDVSGHGAPAALLSVTVSRHITGLQGEAGNKLLEKPEKILASLNQKFTMDNMGDNFFTIAYCVLDLTTLELIYCLAGHPGMIYLPKGSNPTVLDKPAIPIGLFDDSVYSEEKLQLHDGDRLVLYSDGIIEAVDPEKQSFGKDNLKNSLHKSIDAKLPKSFKQVMKDVKDWCKPGRPADDLTILGIEINKNK